MTAFREAVWADVPEGARPEAFERRRRWLLARVPRGARVLDVGCGDGAFAAELVAAGATVVGVDVAEAAVQRARARAPGATFHRIDEGDPLPVANGWAGVAWVGETLEHAVDPAALLADVRLALGAGGTLLLTTPAHGPLVTRTRHLDPAGDHLRFFTARSLHRVLSGPFDSIGLRRRAGRLYACAS